MNSPGSPILSVVIPTHGRPELLRRSILSAICAAPPGQVEVVVVPNGRDQSWKQVADSLVNTGAVTWHPIATQHANAARNHGKEIARGEYLRFLDDDDYLLPGAAAQLRRAMDTGADITSGPVDLVAENGTCLKTMDLPVTEDFVQGMLGPGRRTGFQFHLYRRSAIAMIALDETIAVGQDTHWTHSLVRRRDWSWATTTESVCVWAQHSGTHVSSGLGVSGHLKLQERMLWDTILTLDAQGRLTSHRADAAARGMWSLIHNGYFLSPRYWSRVMKNTRELFPGSLPDLRLYSTRAGRLINPLLLEATMVPKRWANHLCRQTLVLAGLRSQWQLSK